MVIESKKEESFLVMLRGFGGKKIKRILIRLEGDEIGFSIDFFAGDRRIEILTDRVGTYLYLTRITNWKRGLANQREYFSKDGKWEELLGEECDPILVFKIPMF